MFPTSDVTTDMAPARSTEELRKTPVDKREGTDLEWSCVEIRVTTAKACCCCGRSFPGGPDRIRNHIHSVRGGGVAGCTLKNGDPRIQDEFEQIHAELGRRMAAAQAAARLLEQERNDSAAANASACAAAASAAAATSSGQVIDLSQPSIADALAGNMRATTSVEVNLAWAQAFVGCGIPLSVVDNSHFKRAVTLTAQSGSRFLKRNSHTKELESQLADRRAFSGRLLDQTDTDVMARVASIKNPMTKDTGLSVMSDGMENIASRPLLNVLCSNPAGQFFVKVIDATGKDKTKEYIAEQGIAAIEAEGAENVVALYMDGACRSSFSIINAKYPHVICIICAAHTLDLLLEDFAKPDRQGPVVGGRGRFQFDTSFTRETLRANRDIVKFITGHEKTLAIYRKKAEDLPVDQKPRGGSELLKPGDTRFATEFIASERVSNCRLPLKQVVVSSEFTSWLGKQTDTVKAAGAAVADTITSPEHWKKTGAIINMTCPLYALLRLCDGQNRTRAAAMRG